MPCYDPETHDRPERLEKKVHKLTSLLCYLCQKVEDSGDSRVILEHDLLSKWWEDHKKRDSVIAELQKKKDEFGESALTPKELGMLYYGNDISYDETPLVRILL